VKDSLQQLLKKRGSAARVKEVGYWALQATDMSVAYPTWLGAFQQALDGKVESVAGADEAAAVRHADMVVRRTLGSGATKDLPALMRSERGKMVTMFWGFASAQLNQIIGAGRGAQVEWNDGQQYKAVRRLTRIWFTLVGGVVLAELLSGRGPSDYDEDDEITAADWSKWIALKATLAPFTLIPLVGSIIRSGESGRDVSLTPYVQVLGEAAKVGRGFWDLGAAALDEDGDLEEEVGDLGHTMLRASYTVLPGGAQARATLGYWLEEDGGASSDPLGQQAMGTLFGRNREGRLSNALFGEE
jgi:hypothetical protein